MSGFLATALLLLSIGLLEAALGPRGARLTSLLALALLAPVLIHLAAGVDRRSGLRAFALAAGASCAVLWFAGLRHGAAGAASYLVIASSFAFLALAQDPREATRRGLASSLALIALGYGAFIAVRDHATLWPCLYPLSTRVTAAVASFFGTSARLGPTYSGLWLVISFWIAFAARAVVGRPGSAGRRGRAGSPGAAAMSLLAVALLVLLPAVAIGLRRLVPLGVAVGAPVHLLVWRVIAYVLLLVPLAVFLRAHPLPEGRSEGRRGHAGRGRAPLTLSRRRSRRRSGSAGGSPGPAIAAAFVLLVGLGLLVFTPGVPPKTGRVLLDARGEFGLEPLRWGQYGLDVPQGASIANLPPFLEARGFPVTVHEKVLNDSVLGGHDILFVMYPGYAFEESELEAIWSFVERGGGLLVLGDHTNIGGTMEPLNTLLAPSGVRIEFDSAIPLASRWTWYDCMRFHPHPVTRGIRDETDVKISVGASLALPSRAVPLLSGRDAFSDDGDWQNAGGAYLGNMSRDARETLGDLPLAAAVRHGRGKVVVFGDTSPFQRTAIYNSHEFISSIFTYLASPDVDGLPRGARIVGAVLVVVGAAGLFLAGVAALPVLAVACAAGAILVSVAGRVARVETAGFVPGTPLAWIDLAHGNRVDLHIGEDDGINGFVDHLWRGGYIPLGAKRFDAEALDGAPLVATIAPALPFAPAERRALVDYVDGGGLLVVATGYEERSGAEGLLDDFGYAIDPTPIGGAHVAETAFEQRDIRMHESWPVLGGGEDREVWVSSWGYPLVTFERIGRGGLIVIGDSRFLCDVKLESRDRFIEVNIDFLRTALETARNRIASAEEP